MSPSPTARQLWAISITERICSAVSLAGTFIIVVTFISSRSFRKPINRLAFYASWGNIMANVATLISQDGIHAGVGTPICQFQGFLIQWFMPADALWTFCMACNVYLTFFHKFDSDQLRQLEWKYLIFCYGLPLIPAVVYFFVDTADRGPVYGSAILWCWVALPWDFLRIAVFYGPVWLIIVFTFAIYFRAGSLIHAKCRQLRRAGVMETLDSEASPKMHQSKPGGIQVTSEIAFSPDRPQSSISACSFDPYTVTIESGEAHCLPIIPDPGTPCSSMALVRESTSFEEHRVQSPAPRKFNRSGTPDVCANRRRLMDSGSASWAYTKYAMLFFIALLVTWVPSTANRVYSLARPDDFSFCLNFTSAFVLPLQGFWNSLIYICITWPAMKRHWANLQYRYWRWRESRPKT